MTTAHYLWRDLTASTDSQLANEVKTLVVGDRTKISECDSTSAVLSFVASSVEARLLHDLPSAVAILGVAPCSLLAIQLPRPPQAQTLRSAVVQSMVEAKTVDFVAVGESVPDRPVLTPGNTGAFDAWRSELWSLATQRYGFRDRVARHAFEAGIRLICDDLDGSHRCSQAIEGEGPTHTGDYWHAIMHRREPDYGNSKYWFRHVGQHPLFPQLANEWNGLDVDPSAFPRVSAEANSGRWDPSSFVDACETAGRGSSPLQQILQELQYREMLLLLAWSWREANG